MIKNIKLSVFVLLAIITFTSCSAYNLAVDRSKSVNLTSIKLGMSKEEVQALLKKKPDNIVATKNYPETNTMVQVVQYSEWNGDKKLESYWLYFVNDKLDKWETASREHEPWI
ncbi:MAG: hypothetical protein M3O71_29405 [Bacteroidota bacterium]|nr:hypothetical protein [Bacteroidota bacterium]